MRKESDALEARLRKQTTELFGEPRLDGKAVSEELRGGGAKGIPTMPTVTAFDVLNEISAHVTAPDKGKLDILELDIKPKKTYLKGTADTVAQVDELATELAKIDCFESPIQKDKISSVTAQPSGDAPKDPPKDPNSKDGENKPREVKQFALTINTTCP